MIKIGMMLGERYEMLEKIGTGGMSDVYKAKCHKLNRYVAVKVLKQEFSENSNFVSKFRVEAQAAASLMHPNIVNVYDVGEDNGIHYIVMELKLRILGLPRLQPAIPLLPMSWEASIIPHRSRPEAATVMKKAIFIPWA